MSKDFKSWNSLKEKLHYSKKENYFKERDIFWVSIGINIGFEQDGKGALLVQARIYDAKRLENKIGKINQEDFNKLKNKFRELVNV